MQIADLEVCTLTAQPTRTAVGATSLASFTSLLLGTNASISKHTVAAESASIHVYLYYLAMPQRLMGRVQDAAPMLLARRYTMPKHDHTTNLTFYMGRRM